MTLSLDWLPDTAFAYLVLFARIGALLMLMPALGERSIPVRMRLCFALAFAFVVFPLLRELVPTMPNDIGGVFGILLHEVAVGLMIGTIIRITTLAIQIAGAIIAFQTGLSGALGTDPNQAGAQTAVFANFLSFLSLALIFATDLHHLALAAIYESYSVFSLGAPLVFEDFSQLAISTVAGAFSVGIQMAAPFIVFGLIFNLGSGILARLMPALQVYFVLMPANILIGFLLFFLLLSMMMGWYLTAFEDHLTMWRG